MTILEEIARKRQERIDKEGFALGADIPRERVVPLVPFLSGNGLICEIKRRSPSKGIIDDNLDPVKQAGLYKEGGAGNISVLTEEDYFGGSLEDLRKVKEAHPELSVLRKDFLLHREDLELACRAGADAFLLIAALLTPEKLAELFRAGTALGMTPLVEVHNETELRSVAHLKPPVLGINCRDLKNFTLDRLMPLGLMRKIDWTPEDGEPCRVIYESGIFSAEEARFVLGAGFAGILVGEGVVRNQGLAGELARCFQENPAEHYDFWGRLMSRKIPGRPLVKVCGLTREEDLRAAVNEGADLLGFILAPSPRKVEPSFIKELHRKGIFVVDHKSPPLKIGVVVLEEGEDLPEEIKDLLEEGALDGIQFHGTESPDMLRRYPGYKALRPRSTKELERIPLYGPAPVLLDAWRPDAAGGTGERISREILEAVSGPLWLAGGLNPQNIGEVLREFNPYMVDLSSGLEDYPGIKNLEKIKLFFEEISRYEAG